METHKKPASKPPLPGKLEEGILFILMNHDEIQILQ